MMPLFGLLLSIASPDPVSVRVEATHRAVELSLHNIAFDVVPLPALVALGHAYSTHCLTCLNTVIIFVLYKNRMTSFLD